MSDIKYPISAIGLKMAALFAGRADLRPQLNAVRVEVTVQATTLIATDGNAIIVHQTPNDSTQDIVPTVFSIPIANALSLTKVKDKHNAIIHYAVAGDTDAGRYPDWRDVFRTDTQVRKNQSTRFLPFASAAKLNKACALAGFPYNNPWAVQEGDTSTLYVLLPGAIVVLAQTVGQSPHRLTEHYAFAMPLI